jgi:glucose/arabinose dehydrogenase
MFTQPRCWVCLIPGLFAGLFAGQLLASQQVPSDLYRLQVEVVAESLEHPWSLVFLPDGDALISERPGRLRLLEEGRLNPEPVRGLPRIHAEGQGGLLDLALHPDFANTAWLYFSYVDRTQEGYTTRLARGRYQEGRLNQVEILFTALPRSSTGRHFGGRIVFDDQGLVYLSVGDRGEKQRAQDTLDHAGSIIRLHDDGRIPEDNPFYGRQQEGQPEIYAWGTRNAQGMALHPETREVWAQEHGPRGGDEVNLIQAGKNYGWPEVTHGIAYWGGEITPYTEKPGMKSPLWHWTPSIAPSGMLFYTGELFTDWQGQLLVGALKDQLISRLEVQQQGDGWKVDEVERFFQPVDQRIRALYQGEDGSVWVLTDESDGQILRVTPAH